MAQNVSTAVMQRRTEAADSLDDFPTPPWATRALCEWLKAGDQTLVWQSCREPAANRGHMVAPLREYFAQVDASDIHDYGAGFPVRDYVQDWRLLPLVDWTITNPPFRLAEQFARIGRATSNKGCAMLVRLAFLESVGRHERLFRDSAPTDILQFTERVVMHKGRLSANGSTATAYCWLVWRHAMAGSTTRFHWIAPCRKRLERPEDYSQEAA